MAQFVELATATGNSADAKTYGAILSGLNNEFNSAFFSTSNNYYDSGTYLSLFSFDSFILSSFWLNSYNYLGLQSAQSLALFLDLVPPASI